MQSGYIKLYRHTLENPIACKDSDHAAIWQFLLLSATHKERSVSFKGARIILMPGQLITSCASISKQYGINNNKVRRVLILFESELMIKQESRNEGRLITICNWLKDQQPDNTHEPQEN
ncbi:MAG: hypothetical protein KKB51_15810 [Candidatus Riflebacteria bacterium]|nr:hypothetical protein [Candidatus Riflebacteria bacterium]